jgi:hypothetical protein
MKALIGIMVVTTIIRITTVLMAAFTTGMGITGMLGDRTIMVLDTGHTILYMDTKSQTDTIPTTSLLVTDITTT